MRNDDDGDDDDDDGDVMDERDIKRMWRKEEITKIVCTCVCSFGFCVNQCGFRKCQENGEEVWNSLNVNLVWCKCAVAVFVNWIDCGLPGACRSVHRHHRKTYLKYLLICDVARDRCRTNWWNRLFLFFIFYFSNFVLHFVRSNRADERRKKLHVTEWSGNWWPKKDVLKMCFRGSFLIFRWIFYICNTQITTHTLKWKVQWHRVIGCRSHTYAYSATHALSQRQQQQHQATARIHSKRL